MTLDTISQIAISILSVTAIALVARKNKWGFVVGLVSQPFWLWTSYVNKQWGVFLVSIIYVFSWAYGIYVWFFKSENDVK
jgi:hypothetical protein